MGLISPILYVCSTPLLIVLLSIQLFVILLFLYLANSIITVAFLHIQIGTFSSKYDQNWRSLESWVYQKFVKLKNIDREKDKGKRKEQEFK